MAEPLKMQWQKLLGVQWILNIWRNNAKMLLSFTKLKAINK
jgi:hypothetical protein